MTKDNVKHKKGNNENRMVATWVQNTTQINKEATQTRNINNLSVQWKIKNNVPQKKKKMKREGRGKEVKRKEKRAQKTKNLLTQRKNTNGITKNKCNNVLGGQWKSLPWMCGC